MSKEVGDYNNIAMNKPMKQILRDVYIFLNVLSFILNYGLDQEIQPEQTDTFLEKDGDGQSEDEGKEAEDERHKNRVENHNYNQFWKNKNTNDSYNHNHNHLYIGVCCLVFGTAIFSTNTMVGYTVVAALCNVKDMHQVALAPPIADSSSSVEVVQCV